jgi:hypothetical protein
MLSSRLDPGRLLERFDFQMRFWSPRYTAGMLFPRRGQQRAPILSAAQFMNEPARHLMCTVCCYKPSSLGVSTVVRHQVPITKRAAPSSQLRCCPEPLIKTWPLSVRHRPWWGLSMNGLGDSAIGARPGQARQPSSTR